MRINENKDGSAQVWLTQDEYARLLSHVESSMRRVTTIPIRLGAECGLRHAESASVTPGDITESTIDFGENDLLTAENADVDTRTTVYWLEVHGKDTTGGQKRRDVLLPEDIHHELELLMYKKELAHDDPYLDVSKRTVGRWIDDAGDRMAAETGNDDWTYLSSHDLRRYFATTMLQVKGMNPEVVKAVGGWNSYEAMKAYLQDPVEEVITAEYARAGMLE